MKTLQRLALTSAVIGSTFVAAAPAPAEDVDLEMVLLVDTSSSVDGPEFTQQMEGYINAFRDAEVQTAVLAHPNGVAVQMVQWSSGNNFVPLGWRVLRTDADCRALATDIQMFDRVDGGLTQMAPAIDKAMTDLHDNIYVSPRQVIDVSGDGVCANWLMENDIRDTGDPDTGRPWSEVMADRPDSLTINGIAIGESLSDPDQPEIGEWYATTVAQGHNSFALYVATFEEFAQGIKTKLIREIVQESDIHSYD